MTLEQLQEVLREANAKNVQGRIVGTAIRIQAENEKGEKGEFDIILRAAPEELNAEGWQPSYVPDSDKLYLPLDAQSLIDGQFKVVSAGGGQPS